MSFHHEYQRLLSYSNMAHIQYPRPEALSAESLKRIKRFLKLLGNPEAAYKIVHVTGTSGKGSTVHLLQRILTKAGYKASAYVSPHISSFSDRYIFGAGLFTEKQLIAGLKELNTAYEQFCLQDDPLTYFELCTVLAFILSRNAKVDYLVLEVGLGGQYDATNVIPTPELAIITNIDRDHIEILGPNLEDIALKKAGIIKRGGTVLVGETRPALKQIFQSIATKQRAALFFVPPPVAQGEGGLSAGQLHIRTIVRRAAEELGIKSTVVEAILSEPLQLAARFETVQQRPHIIVDAAHSEPKMQSTAEQIKQLKGKVHVLFGASENKNHRAMLKALTEVADKIHITRFTSDHRDAARPRELAKLVPKKLLGIVSVNPQEALKAARAEAKNATLVITGSFFLAGELREHWYPEELIRKQATLFPKR